MQDPCLPEALSRSVTTDAKPRAFDRSLTLLSRKAFLPREKIESHHQLQLTPSIEHITTIQI